MSYDKEFWRYSALDSAVLMDIYPLLMEEVSELGNIDTYNKQVALIEPLVYMGAKGIRVDVEGLKKESKRVGNEIDKLNKEVLELSDNYISNSNSTAQLKEYFYIKQNIKPYTNRKTGQPTVNGDALKRLARKGFKVASTLLRIRKLVKLKGTYLDVKLDKDGRIRCAFNPVGTKSGRLSSSKTIFGTGTNFQNIPPHMRKYMLADEGYMLYNVDLSQAENRVVAFISGDNNMMSAFSQGEDIHSKTAALIFRKSIEEISDKDGSSPIGTGQYSERFWGKKANHSLNYDMGYRSFAFTMEIPEKQAKFIVSSYHTAYAGVRQYYEWVQNQLRTNRTLTNPYGRKRRFMDRWGHELFKEAYSWIPQSTVADKINRDGLLFIYNNQQWFSDVELLNQVHDSIIFQIPLSIDWEHHAGILTLIKESLQREITWRIRTFSIPVDVKVGLNMKDMKKIKVSDSPKNYKLSQRLKQAWIDMKADK